MLHLMGKNVSTNFYQHHSHMVANTHEQKQKQKQQQRTHNQEATTQATR
jgi:hypothetical protein